MFEASSPQAERVVVPEFGEIQGFRADLGPPISKLTNSSLTLGSPPGPPARLFLPRWVGPEASRDKEGKRGTGGELHHGGRTWGSLVIFSFLPPTALPAEAWGSGPGAAGPFEQGPGERPRHQREAEACGHAHKGHILCSRGVVSKCRASADVEDGLASRAQGNKELSPRLPI